MSIRCVLLLLALALVLVAAACQPIPGYVVKFNPVEETP